MPRRYDHIDLRVRSLAEVKPFYDRLLPSLGFIKDISSGQWQEYQAAPEGSEAPDFFGITESPTHVANENRIAFWASSIEDVDRLAAVVREAGGRNIEGPEYEASFYYAVFFEDPGETDWRFATARNRIPDPPTPIVSKACCTFLPTH